MGKYGELPKSLTAHLFEERYKKRQEYLILGAVDEYGIISDEVPVAQWIEHWSPEPVAQVQFLSGTF
jgi:hypothetical protein